MTIIGEQELVMSICGLGHDDLASIEYQFGKENKVEKLYRFTKGDGQKIYRGTDGNYNISFLFTAKNSSYFFTFPQELLGSTITVDIKNLATKNTHYLSCTQNIAY